MVTKEGWKYLIGQKFKEGKEKKQVYKEINDLKQAQIIFKENQREIKSLNKIIEKQDKKIEKLTKLNFDLGLKVNVNKDMVHLQKEETKVNHNNATVKDLKMIMRVMKLENKSMTRTDLMNGCGYTHKRIVPCLFFLSSVNLIKKTKNVKNMERYSLNE